MPSDPLVSVVICCYQAAATLPRALRSLQAQTYTHWECLLVDDDSTDGLADLVAGWALANLRYIPLGENRARGYAQSVVCTLDADDWIYPDKLRLQVDFLERHSDFQVVGTAVGVRGPERLARDLGSHGGRLPFALATAMLRTETTREVGCWPQGRFTRPSQEQQTQFERALVLGRD